MSARPHSEDWRRFMGPCPISFEPVGGRCQIQVGCELNHVRNFLDFIHGDRNPGCKDRRQTVIALTKYLSALVVCNSGNTIEHQADQWFGPLGITPIEFLSFDMDERNPRSQG